MSIQAQAPQPKQNSPLRVFSVRDRVTDDVLEEDLEDATGLLVDETGDTLDTTTTSETADSLGAEAQTMRYDATIAHHLPAW